MWNNKKQKKAGTSPELKADYETYCPERREIFRWVLESIGIAAGLNLLFYRSAAASVLWLPLAWFWIRRRKKQAALKRKQELYYHFRDLTAAMQFAVCAGYSLENAVREAYRDLRQTYGEKDVLVRELKFMKNQIALSIPVEQLFMDLAARSGLADIRMFANVLTISKRTGGNMEAVLKNTWRILSGKIDTEREIASSIASRKYEQTIMNVIPLGIILYIQISFPEFMDVLYGNLLGVSVMTVCLGIYLAALGIGQRIMRIEV